MNDATLQLLMNKYGITMSMEQVAEELDICKDTVRYMLVRKDINGRRAGSRWIIPTQSVADYLTKEPEEPKSKFKYDKKQKLIV